MKFSSKVQKCGLSPMRKFHPYAVAAEAKGRNIYHLNIGQPDIETPKAFFDAVRSFDLPVLEYAPSPGVPALIEAIRGYYAALDMHFAAEDILITNGGSEALQIAMNCILDDGDEILIPEPFYPNYNTMARTCGAVIHPAGQPHAAQPQRRIEQLRPQVGPRIPPPVEGHSAGRAGQHHQPEAHQREYQDQKRQVHAGHRAQQLFHPLPPSL